LRIINPQECQHNDQHLALQLPPSEEVDDSRNQGASLVNIEDESHATADDILTAAAILFVYEFLDNATAA
jgi:hypothetical protein